jgi:hypothetical protein
MLFDNWSSLQPRTDNWFTRARLGIQLWGYDKLLFERLLAASDDLWVAIGRARAATRNNERDVIDRLETVVGRVLRARDAPPRSFPARSRQV